MGDGTGVGDDDYWRRHVDNLEEHKMSMSMMRDELDSLKKRVTVLESRNATAGITLESYNSFIHNHQKLAIDFGEEGGDSGDVE